MARPTTLEHHQPTSWDRARLSVVVPIGVIVAVAIICIVVAVLSSAQRADTVAVDHERQLLAGALNTQAEQVLREVKSVTGSSLASRNIRDQFNAAIVGDPSGDYLVLVLQCAGVTPDQ